MKKIIAVDIDGTLLNSRRKISKKTKDALIKAQRLGHIVAIVSGRDPFGVYPFAKDLEFDRNNGLLSNFNGGRITNFQTKEVIINHPLDIELSKEILKFAEDNLDMGYLIYTNDGIITNSPDTYLLNDVCEKAFTTYKVINNFSDNLDFPINKIMFSQNPSFIDKDAKKLRDKFFDRTNQVKSTPYYYEIMPKGIDKGKSLLDIARYYNMDMKDVIAFGDEENDFSMIELAGVGIAMGNGSDELKKIADFITKSNDEDGIVYYLENYIF